MKMELPKVEFIEIQDVISTSEAGSTDCKGEAASMSKCNGSQAFGCSDDSTWYTNGQ